jgi:transposase
MARRAPPDPKRDALRARGLLNPRAQKVSDPFFDDGAFFDRRDLLQVKYEMLRRVRVDGLPVARAARSFGFSRQSLYQAQAAFEREGLGGLLPDKRGPRTAHKLSAQVVVFLQEQRAANPDITAVALAAAARGRFGVSVHPRSVERALQRAEKKTP